jgi:DHA3 family macrolide efflux protein-like MFS transporter
MNLTPSAVHDKADWARRYFTIWTGQAFSLLGSQLVQFAMTWWLARKTGSATVLALATLAALLPQILIGPFAGALCDRWDRRAVMIAADIWIALATLVLVVLFWSDRVTLPVIYVLLLVRATGTALQWPAMLASTTLMVPDEQLARIAGLDQMLSGLRNVVVPPLGALAMETMPMQSILLIDFATAIPALVSLLLVAIPRPVYKLPREGLHARPSILSDLRDGLTFIIRWRGLTYLTLIGLIVGVLGRAAASLTPLMISQHFGGGALQLGWWQSSYGIGCVVGGLVLGISAGFGRRMLTSMLALMLDGLVCILIGVVSREWFALTIAAMGMLGILEAMIFGLNGAIGQSIVPAEMQGRVFSLATSASLAAAPLGLVVAGPFADAFGVQVWWLISASIITVTGLIALHTPSLVRIEEEGGQLAQSKAKTTLK